MALDVNSLFRYQDVTDLSLNLAPISELQALLVPADNTLLEVSQASLVAADSVYQMSSGVPVEFRTSGSSCLLYLDETNERVGIGVNAPSYNLDVSTAARIQNTGGAASMRFDRTDGKIAVMAAGANGSAFGFDDTGFFNLGRATRAILLGTAYVLTNDLYISSAGQIGIGHGNPSAKLDVVGTIQFETGNEAAGTFLKGDASGNADWALITQADISDYTADTLYEVSQQSLVQADSLYQMTTGVPVEFRRSGGSTLMYLDESNGRVGIGTNSPNVSFEVEIPNDDTNHIRLGNLYIRNIDSTSTGLDASTSSGLLKISSNDANFDETAILLYGVRNAWAAGSFRIGNIAGSVDADVPTGTSYIQGSNAGSKATTLANAHGGDVVIFGGNGNSGTSLFDSAGGDVLIDGGSKANSGTDGNVILAASRGYVGVSTLNPSANLDVVGTLQFETGNEGANKILTSDASGNADWTNPSSIGLSAEAFKTISLSSDTGFTWGSADVVADAYDDTLKIVPGDGIEIESDATNDALRISTASFDIPTTASYVGVKMTFTAGATIAAGEIVALNSSGNAVPASGDSLGIGPAVGIATEAATSTNPVKVLVQGFAYIASHGLSVGAIIYAANTNGDMTTTEPTTTGDFKQIIGQVESTNVLYIAPELNRIEIA